MGLNRIFMLVVTPLAMINIVLVSSYKAFLVLSLGLLNDIGWSAIVIFMIYAMYAYWGIQASKQIYKGLM